MLVKVCNQIVQPLPLSSKTAGERRIVPVDTKEFRYLRFKAIGALEWPSAGPNGNWDGFPYGWFEDERPGFGYRSFIGKRAHVEHNSNMGLSGSIGDLPDAYLNRYVYSGVELPKEFSKGKVTWQDLSGKKYADLRSKILSLPNQKDGSIEVLMRIDTNLVKSSQVESKTKKLLERIVRMIDTGQKLTCSMGANVMYSVCSSCGNLARFSNEYCEHLQHRKGSLSIVPANQIRDLLDKDLLRPEWLRHTIASSFDVQEILKGTSNKGVAARNIEINHELSFFELSVVATPAYPDAVMIEKLARKQTESKKEYLERISRELGEDAVLELYSFLQERGLIGNSCSVN